MVTGPATPCRCIASEQLPPKPPGVPARPPPKRSPPSRRVAPLTGGSPPRGAHRPSRRRRFPRTDVATTGIRGPGRQRLIRQLCRNLYSCTNSWRRPNCHGGWLPPEPPGAPARTNPEAPAPQQHPAPAPPARAAAPPPSCGYLFASKRPQPVNTDRWYYRVFQSAPDLIRSLLPGSAAAANALGLDPAAPGDRLYRFQALELKELSHRLDGVL